MEIIIGKNSGFCFGVKRAVDGVENTLKEHSNVKCLGSIVHNEVVIGDLEKKGVKFIKSMDEVRAGDTLIFRAHGVEEKLYKEAKEKNVEIIDYTCPKVALIHEQIKEAESNGYHVIIVGKKSHPEVLGSKGWARNADVIEEIADIDSLANYDKVFCIAQTTYSLSKFLEIEKELKEKYKDMVCVNSICPSTKIRQQECEELSKKVDFMIIVGGSESSNTKKLYEIAVKNNRNSILVGDECDKKIEESKKYGIIGIMSGASTPSITVEKIVEKIQESI